MCDHSPGQGDEPTEQDKVKLSVPSNPPSLSSAVATSSLFPWQETRAHRTAQRSPATNVLAGPGGRSRPGRDAELLRQSNWQGRGLDATAAHEQEAGRAATWSRIVENAHGGETPPSRQEGRSVEVLQERPTKEGTGL